MFSRIDFSNNDNVKLNKKNNDNDNVLKKVSVKEADQIAEWLVEKLCSPGSRSFYCKVAYKMTLPEIHSLLATALEKGHDPAKYFTFLANLQIRK